MSELGKTGERHLAYYLELTKGVATMIVIESMPVHQVEVFTRGNLLKRVIK